MFECCLQATRIFASNLKEKMAQRFYNLVLLPRVRDDIAEYKKINFHLYQSLRKALYKPGAFMKGILLPLLEVTYTNTRVKREAMETRHFATQSGTYNRTPLIRTPIIGKKCLFPNFCVNKLCDFVNLNLAGQLWW